MAVPLQMKFKEESREPSQPGLFDLSESLVSLLPRTSTIGDRGLLAYPINPVDADETFL